MWSEQTSAKHTHRPDGADPPPGHKKRRIKAKERISSFQKEEIKRKEIV
jgi:hypothetical protein